MKQQRPRPTSGPKRTVSGRQMTQSPSAALAEVRRQLIGEPAGRRPGDAKKQAASADGSLRERARSLATAFAGNLDATWTEALLAPPGPIDVVDMFSGCGGMSTGFRAVNGIIPAYNLVVAVDIDEVANQSYAANLGLVPSTESVAALARDSRKVERLLRSGGRRDNHPLVVIGCAPCQGFSSHRNADGEGDARNSLFFNFASLASRLRPDAIIVENVPELLTDRYWEHIERAREKLEGAGYYVHVTVHNMAGFGVPQERFRALIVALPRPFLPPRAFVRRDSFRTVRDAIGHLPAIRAGERHVSDPMHYTAGHKDSTLETIRAVPLDGGSRPDGVGPACLRRAKELRGRAIYEDVYGRLFWDRPAITVTAYARNPASGRFVHPAQDRGLSVREAALLQSFPSAYQFSGGLDERFRQIGNAVPPAFSGHIALWLLGELLASAGTGEPFDRGITKPIGASFSRMIPAFKAGHRDRYVDHRQLSLL